MKGNFERLRLQEFNDFDIERLLKNNVDSLDAENVQRMDFIEENQTELNPAIIVEFAESIENNAAEMLYVTSILHHTNDIYTYFSKGPLFREDREK